MPKSACYTFAWSSSHQAYELYAGQRDEALDLVPESPGCLMWVSQVSSFAFHGKNGSYTARKERKQRGTGYWYAYVRVEGKLTKRYLGRSTDLTLARLELVAQELWCDAHATFSHEKCEVVRLLQSSSVTKGEQVCLAEQQSELHAVSAHLHSARRSGHGVSDLKIQASPTVPRPSIDALLATKLHVPRPRPHLVHRPRLFQRLQQGMERALTLLSVPAGFGKSTLLADWLAASAITAAWLSLEPQDNEPRRFLAYLIAALRTYDPHLGTAALAFLDSLPSVPIETVLTLLLNDLLLGRAGNQAHIVLILDNYQVITVGPIHHALSFLLDHLPPQMHIILATREDPPLSLIHLRGRDAILELRAADLRFTPQETATYLIEVMGLPLSAEESALLQERTEGWITGLQLAARSLLGRDDPSSFIKVFTGSHHYIVEYLLEEVLSRQCESVQDFLLQTCILERLCPSLCDAVRGQEGSQALLDSLERANLFLIALDEERQWYRYHHLFAEVLRQRLQQTIPTLIADLHRRASHWYEQHGLFAAAISHALAAPAFEDAARLIERYAWMFLADSQMQTLCEWLPALPETLVLAHPSLCVIHAIALMYTNHLEAASARLKAAEQGLDLMEDMQAAHRCALMGQLVAGWSLQARISGDLEQCVALSHRALDLLPETDATPLPRLLRIEALLNVASAYLVNGSITTASERLLVGTIASARTSSNYRLLISRGLGLLARLFVLQGRLRQAAATYEEVVRLAPRPEGLQVLVGSPAYHFGLGDLLREWNELEAAERHLEQGMNLLNGTLLVDADEMWLSYATLAHLQHARGRCSQALATLDAFTQLAHRRYIAPALVAQAAALRAHMELAQGNLQAALRWVDSSGLSVDDAPSYPREREYLTLARILIAEEHASPTDACLSAVLSLLERLLAEATADKRMRSVLEILLLLALALQVRGDRPGALATLGDALTLAEPEGYIRLFLDEGPSMIALLRQAQRHHLAPRYVAKLLEAASKPGGTDAHLQAPQHSLLVEPLTAREREVLLLLLNGASNQEIANHLTISVNTAKKHILNICGKLNVQSRAQAIVRARMLHLL